ncbi:MAG: type II secretion system protein [Patescibacteria group bacterium]
MRLNRAFTLIELLVVIAIISLLSSLVFSALAGARKRAEVAEMISNFNQIEKALYLWMDYENRSQWWVETTWLASCAYSPTINCLSGATNLRNFLPNPPEYFRNQPYRYDNDGDTFDSDGDGCDSNPTKGVNIMIFSVVDLETVSMLDDALDGGDGAICGRIVWWAGQNMAYRIANSSQDY